MSDAGVSSSPILSRRDLLKTLGATGLTTGLSALSGCILPPSPSARRGLIAHENERPGTSDWMLSETRVDPATKYRCPWVEGYCSRTSVRAGESLRMFVSTNPPSPFVVDLYRLGYYGGKGGRFLMRLGPFSGNVQPD